LTDSANTGVASNDRPTSPASWRMTSSVMRLMSSSSEIVVNPVDIRFVIVVALVVVIGCLTSDDEIEFDDEPA